MSQKKLHLVSLGCTKNLVDSEVMLGRLREYEISDDAEASDVIIVNTCGFIDAAKEESINTILNLHDVRKKNSLLVVSGCLTERYQEELQRDLPEVDIFTGVGDYEKIDQMINERRGIFSPSVYLANEKSDRVITGSNTHAYIKIAEGCNQSCSFCAIPSFKGKLLSRTLGSIEKEIKALVKKGFYEFSFISQDSSSFGRDLKLKDGLIDLIKTVESIEGVTVARILYLYPSTTSFELIDAIADSKVFETYYDMPIQQIDDGILKLMRRGFGEKKTIALLEHMKSKKDAFIRTSIIAGHPGETVEAFERVCEFMKEFKFDRFNVFFYSNEETTPAFTMKPVEVEVIEERIEVLEEIAIETTEYSLENMLGKNIRVILDGESDEHEYILSARPTLWAKDIDGDILINDTSDLEIVFGALYEVKVTQFTGDRLLGTLIKAL
ncbi:MAG: Ribosomal protein S12p Asp88 (E. coli) methylthiotransferase [uncultured Sulfurovum sp.]|uniref:Ribosomal protein uS12 methylthiotransferase RimO n=1 Tax=uncultured Sulfurovum sp. TaxID=269237 RepID=A0A6S6TI33_9BACT|nr:MAG: Ribosomal protein S12p Asp88 (E. coli) methylthiotransferase [uncultured Sulfurovum sp.]